MTGKGDNPSICFLMDSLVTNEKDEQEKNALVYNVIRYGENGVSYYLLIGKQISCFLDSVDCTLFDMLPCLKSINCSILIPFF